MRAFPELWDTGVMLFPITATEFRWRDMEMVVNGTEYVETCVFRLVNDRLRIVLRNSFVNKGKHVFTCVIGQETAARFIVDSPIEFARRTEICRGLSHPVLRRDAFWPPPNQQACRSSWEHRAIGVQARTADSTSSTLGSYPRESWEITIRWKHARGVPKNQAIIADVMRAVHAVRAHMRTNHRTGLKDIKVRDQVRGANSGIQIKEYKVK